MPTGGEWGAKKLFCFRLEEGDKMDCPSGERGRLTPSDQEMWQKVSLHGGTLWGFGSGLLGVERGPFDLEKDLEGFWGQVLGECWRAGVHCSAWVLGGALGGHTVPYQ